MRPAVLLLLLFCVGSTSAAHARAYCYSDQECAPWQVCTVSLGECGGAAAPLDVCTGRCVAGASLRVVPRVGAAALALGGDSPDGSDGTDVGASVGLELVPPVLGGHVAVAVDYWTHELLRTGAIVSWAVRGVALGVRGDLTTLTGEVGAMVGARLDLFPNALMPALTPAHYFSIHVEGGAWFADAGEADATPFAAIGLGLWVY